MNQAISLQRLSLLCGFYWNYNRRQYMFMLLAVASGLTLWHGLNLFLKARHLFDEQNQIGYYFGGLFLSGCLSGSLLFSDLSAKPRATSYLLLPASHLEKMICILVFGVVGYFMAYSATFYLVDSVMVYFANNAFGTSFSVIKIYALDSYGYPDNPMPSSLYFYLYFIVNGLFIVGSVYFRKYSLFKTVAVALLLWVFYIVVTTIIMHLIPPGIIHGNIYEVFEPSGENKLISLPSFLQNVSVFFLKYLLVAGLWAAAYFRLKEKQII